MYEYPESDLSLGRIVRTLAQRRGIWWSWYTRRSGNFSQPENGETSRGSHVHGESSRQNDQSESRMKMHRRKLVPKNIVSDACDPRTGYEEYVFAEFTRADQLQIY